MSDKKSSTTDPPPVITVKRATVDGRESPSIPPPAAPPVAARPLTPPLIPRSAPEPTVRKSDRYSDEVENALKAVLPSTDAMDAPDFDPIQFINDKFSENTSIEEIETFSTSLRKEIITLDTKIVDTIRDQSFSGKQAEKDLSDAKVAIHELFNKIKDIKIKAEQSEVMVQEICRDIKQLDWAKKHLTATISALKRLQMLVTAIDRLHDMTGKRDYKQAASLMGAVNQLSKNFDGYSKVPKVRDLTDRVNRIKEELSHQVFEDFNEMGEIVDMPDTKSHTVESLHNACLVVDALEGKTKQRLINAFAKTQIRKYERVFRIGGEESGLNACDSRFSWYRKMLKEYDSFYGTVFPYYWRVPQKLTLQFCEKTAEHFQQQLSKFGNPENVDAAPMLIALQKSLAFEKEMQKRFDNADIANSEPQTPTNEEEEPKPDLDENGDPIDPSSSAGIKLKYKRKKIEEEKAKKAEVDRIQLESYNNKIKAGMIIAPDKIDAEVIPTIIGSISKCFEPYMIGYVKMEKSKLQELAAAGSKDADAASDKGGLSVLESSIKMFLYMNSSIKRCTELSNGQTFFALQKEFIATLFAYIDGLQSKMPKPQKVLAIGPECYKLKDDAMRDFISLCINTCEYCAETVTNQLATKVKDKIADEFKEQVDFDPVTEKFYELINLSLTILVSGVDVELDNALSTMQGFNWASVGDVGDTSKYVLQCNEIITRHIPPIRKSLNQAYFRSFSDKLVTSFLPRFTNSLFKCRQVNEMGAQQLLLDTNAMKTLFLKLPQAGLDAAAAQAATPSPTYNKFVTTETSKAESILKLVGTPADRLSDSFQIMYGAQGSSETLVKIMQLKGMPKTEQKDLLTKMGLSTSVADAVSSPTFSNVVKQASIQSGIGLTNVSTVPSNITGAMRGLFARAGGK